MLKEIIKVMQDYMLVKSGKENRSVDPLRPFPMHILTCAHVGQYLYFALAFSVTTSLS